MSKDIDRLIADLESDDEDVCVAAVEKLGAIGDARAVEPLVELLWNEDEFVREVTAEALGKIGESALESLIKALKDKNNPYPEVHSSWPVREAAAIALGEIGDVRAVEPLIEAAMDLMGTELGPWGMGVVERYHIDMCATTGEIANALGKIGDVRAVETLIEMTGSGGEFWDWAAEALRKIGDARAVDSLIELIRDKGGFEYEPEALQRRQYALALGLIGDARAVEPLITTLGDKDERVREAAAKALGQIGDARAVEPLIETLGAVPLSAARALGKIAEVHMQGKEKENMIKFFKSNDPAIVLMGASMLKGSLKK